jgi:hypothetical protein
MAGFAAKENRFMPSVRVLPVGDWIPQRAHKILAPSAGRLGLASSQHL